MILRRKGHRSRQSRRSERGREIYYLVYHLSTFTHSARGARGTFVFPGSTPDTKLTVSHVQNRRVVDIDNPPSHCSLLITRIYCVEIFVIIKTFKVSIALPFSVHPQAVPAKHTGTCGFYVFEDEFPSIDSDTHQISKALLSMAIELNYNTVSTNPGSGRGIRQPNWQTKGGATWPFLHWLILLFPVVVARRRTTRISLRLHSKNHQFLGPTNRGLTRKIRWFYSDEHESNNVKKSH